MAGPTPGPARVRSSSCPSPSGPSAPRGGSKRLSSVKVSSKGPLYTTSAGLSSIDFMPMRVPPARVFFPDEDRAEVLARIDQALSTGQLTLGPTGRELEEAFARRHRVAHAIAVSSGTSALEIILRAIGVEGREVLVPANTFFATAAAAAHAGARVKFVDCDPRTMSFDLDDVAGQITDQTAAVIAVHIGGLISPAVPALAQLCN